MRIICFDFEGENKLQFTKGFKFNHVNRHFTGKHSYFENLF